MATCQPITKLERQGSKKPTDVVLPVPSYDLNLDDLPLSSRLLDELLVTQQKRREKRRGREKQRPLLTPKRKKVIQENTKLVTILMI